MKRNELQRHVKQLAETLGLRWLARSRRFLGIHQGMIVDLSEWDGIVSFVFVSPSAHVGDQILEDFRGFVHVAEAGVPTAWISGIMECGARGLERTSDCGCRLSIDSSRVDSIGVETFHQIPNLIARDFRDHGGAETLLCINGDEKEARTVGFLNRVYQPMCDDCWIALQFHTSGGRLATEQSVNWALVIPLLSTLTVVGAFIWGFLQQPERLDRFGFTTMLLPAAWAFVLCRTIGRVSGGVTLTLRLSLFASVIISVLAGNIWGFRSLAIEQIEKQLNQRIAGPSLIESAQWYFAGLPNNWQAEAPFLVGGLLGAWIGLRTLKAAETIDVQ